MRRRAAAGRGWRGRALGRARRIGRALLLAVLLASVLLVPPKPASTASTGTTALFTMQGNGAGLVNGDFVTAGGGGLNTVGRFFVEVPPGVGHLVVQIFDADVGRGGSAEAAAGRDRNRNGFDTSVDYRLFRPDGSGAATLAGCNDVDPACADNAWTTLLDSTTAQNTAAGHWEIRVNMSSSVTTGDDVNAFGIRATDGDPTGGGTELPIYVDSIAGIGVNPPASGTDSRTYPLQLYVTSGCQAFKNDFDYDSDSGNVGSIAVTSRIGAFTHAFTSSSLSQNNEWRRDAFSGWTTDATADDYGIWLADLAVNSYHVSGTPNGN
jgi:hypothetical protein